MGTWRTLQPRRIVHAPGAFSVRGDVLSGDPRTRSPGPELSALPIGALFKFNQLFHIYLSYIIFTNVSDNGIFFDKNR